MPFKYNAARRHRVPNARHRVRNWREYESGLRRRGDLTLWVDEAAMAGAQGCTAEVVYDRVCQQTVNDPEHAALAAKAAASLVGEDAVDANTPPITGGEDFSDMLRVKPGAFIFIGNGVGPDGSFHSVHTPHYDFNDDILTLGAGYWVTLVRQELAAAA